MAGPGTRLAVVVHHDDAAREFAYDRSFHFGKLDRGLAEAGGRGRTLLSMRRDPRTVYPEPKR